MVLIVLMFDTLSIYDETPQISDFNSIKYIIFILNKEYDKHIVGNTFVSFCDSSFVLELMNVPCVDITSIYHHISPHSHLTQIYICEFTVYVVLPQTIYKYNLHIHTSVIDVISIDMTINDVMFVLMFVLIFIPTFDEQTNS